MTTKEGCTQKIIATPAVHAVQPLPAELPDEAGHTPGLLDYANTDQFDQSLDVFEEKTARTIFRTVNSLPMTEQQANAERLVHLWNGETALLASHARLVAALEKILEISKSGVLIRHETGQPTWYASEETAELCRAALAAAKGQA